MPLRVSVLVPGKGGSRRHRGLLHLFSVVDGPYIVSTSMCTQHALVRSMWLCAPPPPKGCMGLIGTLRQATPSAASSPDLFGM